MFACFFCEGVVGAICCSGIFDSGINKKIRPRVPQGRPKSDQGGTPRGSEKLVAKKTRRMSITVSDNQLQNGSRHLTVWRNVGNMFLCSPALFFDGSFNCVFDNWGSI